MSMRKIELGVDVEASAEHTWAALVDWKGQEAWMPATRVDVVGGGPGHGVGERIVAYTGIGRVAVADRMTITAWDPPRRAEVAKTGRLLKGGAFFEVRPLGPDRARVTWTEALTPPFGAPGRALGPFLSVGTRAVIGLALRRFARHAASTR